MITVLHVILLVVIVFFLALVGCLCRRNILVSLMFSNVLVSSVCLFFVALSRYYPNSPATMMALITMILGALSTVLSLTLWIVVQRKRETQNLDELNILRD